MSIVVYLKKNLYLRLSIKNHIFWKIFLPKCDVLSSQRVFLAYANKSTFAELKLFPPPWSDYTNIIYILIENVSLNRDINFQEKSAIVLCTKIICTVLV